MTSVTAQDAEAPGRRRHPSLRGLRQKPGTRNWFLDNCAVCRREFEFHNRNSVPLRKNRQRTCSHACSQEYRRRRSGGKREVRCVVCDAAFRPERGQARTCSDACRRARRLWHSQLDYEKKKRSETHGCPACGRPVPRNGRIYCSASCRTASRGGGRR